MSDFWTTQPSVSADTLTLYASLPAFVQAADQTSGYPLLCFLEGAGSQLQAIDTLVRDSGAVPGWSMLLDVTRCPTADLPWLAQFLGIRFTAAQQTDAQMRTAIKTPTGWGRGTPAAILAAAAPWMKTGILPTLEERTTDAYHLTILIPSAGLLGLDYGELDETYATYAAVDSAFATYGAMTQDTTDVENAVLGAVPAAIVATVTFD